MEHQQHFLIAIFPFQGHITPARGLAGRIVRAAGAAGARVTISTAVSAHRRMFPSLATPDGEASDGAFYYVPYSDGFDDGIDWTAIDPNDHVEKSVLVSSATLSAVIEREALLGRPVTMIIYTLAMYWVAEVAKDHGIPCALFWVQPATVLAAYYHYYHGFDAIVDEHVDEPEFEITFPSMAPMKIRDFPSFITKAAKDHRNAVLLDMTRKTLESVKMTRGICGLAKTKVLVNTADVLEPSALASLKEWDVIPIGPMIPSFSSSSPAVFERDEKNYVEWLGTKAAMSVVYVSFGSISVYKPRQLEAIKKALVDGGRPFLWVVRSNNGDVAAGDVGEIGDGGMVVKWCSQMEVLSHPAVGCFVTHCGWNSTLESVACGVPVVAVPQWVDQTTNAKLVVDWNVGIRGDVDEEGVIDAEELRRCIDAVMSDADVRRSADRMKDKLRAAVGDGGSSELNFREFLKDAGRRHVAR